MVTRRCFRREMRDRGVCLTSRPGIAASRLIHPPHRRIIYRRPERRMPPPVRPGADSLWPVTRELVKETGMLRGSAMLFFG